MMDDTDHIKFTTPQLFVGVPNEVEAIKTWRDMSRRRTAEMKNYLNFLKFGIPLESCMLINKLILVIILCLI